MINEIRRLHPADDHRLFMCSYHWITDSPVWRQHTEAVFGTLDFDQYMSAAWEESRIDIGIWSDGAYNAKVALHLVAKNTYEVSLESDRSTSSDAIIAAGLSIRDQLFGQYGAESVFAWVPRWARGVQAILLAIGFRADGVTMLRGQCRGRTIEWLRFSIGRAYEQQEQTTATANAAVQQCQHLRLANTA